MLDGEVAGLLPGNCLCSFFGLAVSSAVVRFLGIKDCCLSVWSSCWFVGSCAVSVGRLVDLGCYCRCE